MTMARRGYFPPEYFFILASLLTAVLILLRLRLLVTLPESDLHARPEASNRYDLVLEINP